MEVAWNKPEEKTSHKKPRRLPDRRISFKEDNLTAGSKYVFNWKVPTPREGEDAVAEHVSSKPRGKRRRVSVKLWWMLISALLVIFVALFIPLIAISYSHHTEAMETLETISTDTLDRYHDTSTRSLNLLAAQLHARASVLSSSVISQFLERPLLVVQNNADFMNTGDDLSLFLKDTTDSMLYLWSQMWNQLSRRYDEVDAIYYVDLYGTFAGYARTSEATDVQHPGALYQSGSGGAGAQVSAEYRPSFGYNYSAVRSPCPGSCGNLTPGRKHVYAVDGQTGVLLDMNRSDAYDTTGQTWYLQARAARNKTIWVMQHSINSKLSLWAVSPNAIGEFVLTMHIVEVRLSTLTRFLQDTDPNRTGIIFIVDRDGNMISSSTGMQQVVGLGSDGRERQLHWSETGADLITTTAESLLEGSNGSWAALNESSIFQVGGGGRDGIIISHQVVRNGDGLQSIEWIVVNAQPTYLYLGEIEVEERRRKEEVSTLQRELEEEMDASTRFTVLMCVIFLLVGVIAMAFVAHLVTRPLRKVMRDMQSVAKLEFMDLEDELKAVQRERSAGGDGSSGDRSNRSFVREVAEMHDAFLCMANGLRSFSKYMDPYVVQVVTQSKQEARLGMAEADVTIFFSDIANFTSIAETLQPQQLMSVLSTYFDEMSAVIMRRSGVVGEFIGDAIMAWYNAPLELGQHTAIALAAALEQQGRLKELQQKWTEEGLPDIRVRMGLVRGQVLAGNVGSTQRMKYGLVGDSVNLASRLEGLCKRYGVGILMDRAAQEAPGVKEEFFCRPIDLVTVKGRSGVTEVFELVARKPEMPEENLQETSKLNRFCHNFATIHACYRERYFQAALHLLAEYQLEWPADVPAMIMKERCQQLLSQKLDEDWSPIEKLHEK